MSQTDPFQLLSQALVQSETRLARALVSGKWSIEAPETEFGDMVAIRRPSEGLNEHYYDRLHKEAALYQQNNWMLSEKDIVLANNPKSILEIGCGNGLFAKAVAPFVDAVFAVDWARSPLLRELGENITFLQKDAITDPLPQADLVCSADVLEHFKPSDVPVLLRKLADSAQKQHHVIACYDDGHSHLSVMPPGAWLACFWAIDPSFRLVDVRIRRSDVRQLVCVISNLDHPS